MTDTSTSYTCVEDDCTRQRHLGVGLLSLRCFVHTVTRIAASQITAADLDDLRSELASVTAATAEQLKARETGNYLAAVIRSTDQLIRDVDRAKQHGVDATALAEALGNTPST